MPPNILLVVLDSVRAKNTSIHGYKRKTTPFLADFAEKEIVFSQARAPSVASLPSHVSMFTGYHTKEHNFGNDNYDEYRLAEGVTIWETLRSEYDYQTGVFSTNPYLTSLSVGLNSKFDTVIDSELPPYPDAIDPRKYHSPEEGIDFLKWGIDSLFSGKPFHSLLNGVSIGLASDSKNRLPSNLQLISFPKLFSNWINNTKQRPWAACINLMDAHTPYKPAQNFDNWSTSDDWELQDQINHFRWEFASGKHDIGKLRRLMNLYDGCILQADNKVREIISVLEKRDCLSNTLIVITSDHGEGFGEESNIHSGKQVVGHTVGIHESQLHVPLVIHLPRDTRSRDIDCLATLTNFPSVVERVVQRKENPEEALVEEEKVVATQLSVGDDARHNAESYGIDMDTIPGRLTAAYEKQGDDIYKFICQDDKVVKVSVSPQGGTGKPEVVSENCYQPIFRNTADIDVKIRESSKIDKETKERLSDLGYA